MARKLMLAFIPCLAAAAWWFSFSGEKEATTPGSTPLPGKSRREAARPRGAEAVAAALRSDRSEERQLALDTLLPDLMARDMVAAAELAAELPGWAGREQALLRVSDVWGASDPGEAAAWAAGLGTPEERRFCLAAICRQAARTDPALAIGYALDSVDGEDPALLEHLAATYIASEGPGTRKEAAVWIRATWNNEDRDRFWAAGVRMMAENAPEKAANLAVEHISPGPVQDEAVISILHQWSRHDRAAAAAWVALFPEGEFRTRAEKEIKP